MAMTKQFTKTQWNNNRDPAITAEQLNRMEKGIDDNDTRIVELDKAVTANKTAGDNSLAEVNKTLQKHTDDITAVNTELTSQGKAIGELADKKITKFYASSQGESTLNDSDNGKMQDMMIYGKSEQKQYSGKNLLNATLQTTTQNGVTCTNNDDGTYTLNGTATANAYFHVSAFTFNKGANYRLIGCPKGGNMDTKYGLYVDQIWAKDNGQGVTFSTNQTLEEKIIIVVVSGNSINNLVFKPMLVNADTYPSVTYNDFEPYVGGIPSPNPDYPQEIKSVVEPVVDVYGKNILDNSLFSVGYWLNANGVISENSDRKAFLEYIEVESNVKYYVSCFLQNGEIDTNIYAVNLLEYDFGQKLIAASPQLNSSKEITMNEKTKYIRVALADKTDFLVISKPQSVPLTGITLNAIPVSSGGNVTIDGQQYISDYVDVERGKIVRMVGEKILNGSEIWVPNGNDGGRVLYTPLYTAKQCIYFNSNTRSLNPVLSNMLLQAKENYIGVGLYKTSLYNSPNIKDYPGKNWLYINIGKLKNEAIQFLQNNNITVYYPLATPTEESLSDELAEKLKALQTYYPQTNLFITSNQLDGYAIFNYPISLANGWNYVKQQIGDTRDYIYDMDLQMAQAYVNSEYAVALTELEV